MTNGLAFLLGAAGSCGIIILIFALLAEKRGSNYVIEIGFGSPEESRAIWAGIGLMLLILGIVWFLKH